MNRLLLALMLAAGLGLATPAGAQLGLPVPQTPAIGGALGDVTNAARDTATTTTDDLRDLRRTRVRDLLRTHRRELQADPDGQPIVRSQILALAPTTAALERARAAGFGIVATDDLGELGGVVTLRAPAGMTTRSALRQLREADPQGVYDFDHLYIESGAGPLAKQISAPGGGPRIGLIDTGVSGGAAAQRGFAAPQAVAAAHGTAVATLLRASAPGAQVYVADIYGGAPTGGASSALARALGWLASERTPVINISLVGPRNRIIEALISQLIARGFVIVAAVGNDGPAAPPLFPAAYDGVIGVTGVDARDRVLVEAGRGPQVDFAALGIIDQRTRGTSFAAPLVAGALATRLDAPNPQNMRSAIAALRSQARDLGAHGRDNVYGDGLVVIAGGNVASR